MIVAGAVSDVGISALIGEVGGSAAVGRGAAECVRQVDVWVCCSCYNLWSGIEFGEFGIGVIELSEEKGGGDVLIGKIRLL